MLWTQFVSGRDISDDDARFRCTFDPQSYSAYQCTVRHLDETGTAPFWDRAGVPVIGGAAVDVALDIGAHRSSNASVMS